MPLALYEEDLSTEEVGLALLEEAFNHLARNYAEITEYTQWNIEKLQTELLVRWKCPHGYWRYTDSLDPSIDLEPIKVWAIARLKSAMECTCIPIRQ